MYFYLLMNKDFIYFIYLFIYISPVGRHKATWRFFNFEPYWRMLFVITCKFLDVHNWCRYLTFATLKDEDGNPLETEYGLSTYKDHQTFTIQVKCWSLWFAQMASLLVHFLLWHSTLLFLAGNARKSPCRTAASFSRHHFW